MDTFNGFMFAIGLLLLFTAIAAGLIKNKWFMSEPLLAMILGIVIGPECLDWFALERWGNATGILEHTARLTLSIALIGVAIGLPADYVRKNWKMLAVLLGFLMPIMCGMSALAAWLVFGTTLWISLLIGAVITPTDPVVASSIISGKIAKRFVPERLRLSIAAESGANDALALPLVMLPLMMLTRPAAQAWSDWVLHTILWGVIGGAAIGVVVGWAVARVLIWFRTQHDSEPLSLITVSLGLSIAVTGGVRLAGSDGLLAAFVAGLVLGRIIKTETKAKREHLNEALRRFFDLPVFVLIGMALPWHDWFTMGWRAVVFPVAILLLRRMPGMFALRGLIQPINETRDVLFIGWFGPIGAAALYYSMLAVRETGNEIAWTAGSLAIASSVLVHGVTATPFQRAYGHRDAAAQKDE